MKSKLISLAVLLLMSGITSAQVGIGTQTPDSSAILDLTSDEQGFLVPRMNTAQRNLINPIATGLMIFNTQTASFNYYNGTTWKDISPSSSEANAISYSVNDSAPVETVLQTDALISGMTITPGAGKYLVSFNGTYESPIFKYDVNMTNQCALDLLKLYTRLKARTTNAIPRLSPTFGNGEIITPGAYSFAGATDLNGTLYLDGYSDSVFIFDLGAAFTSGASANVVLSGGVQACNIFWLAQGAIGLGANTIIKGNLFSRLGAVSMASGCSLVGRMLTTAGALTFEKATITAPTGESDVDVGLLESFALYTSSGAITAEATQISTVTGDIGSNLGIISGFIPEINQNATLIGNKYGPTSPEVTIDKNVLSTFSVFQNGVLVPNSERTRRSRTPSKDITLQAVTNVLDGEAIEVKWKTDVNVLKMTNRILTIVKTE
jgi:hypothetical protein